MLEALLELRSFLFDAVYENQIATAESGKAAGNLGGLWEKVRQRPEEFLDTRTIAAEGVDVAACDFLAGQIVMRCGFTRSCSFRSRGSK